MKKVGADEVITYTDLKESKNLPLLKEKYSGVIDTLGLESISSCLKQIKKGGKLIVIGNVSSENINISLMPLILRGISIIGVNAESANIFERKKIWSYLAKINNSKKLVSLYKEIGLNDANKYIKKIRENKHHGRVIVNLKS